MAKGIEVTDYRSFERREITTVNALVRWTVRQFRVLECCVKTEHETTWDFIMNNYVARLEALEGKR